MCTLYLLCLCQPVGRNVDVFEDLARHFLVDTRHLPTCPAHTAVSCGGSSPLHTPPSRRRHSNQGNVTPNTTSAADASAQCQTQTVPLSQCKACPAVRLFSEIAATMLRQSEGDVMALFVERMQNAGKGEPTGASWPRAPLLQAIAQADVGTLLQWVHE